MCQYGATGRSYYTRTVSEAQPIILIVVTAVIAVALLVALVRLIIRPSSREKD